MRFDTPFTRLFGIDCPIALAPMGNVSGGRLAAAVSRSGGLGLLGPGYRDEAWIRSEFEVAGEAPVGIGFITWHLAQHPKRLEAALAFNPIAVMLSFGDASSFVERIKKVGSKLMLQVQSVADARVAADLGADVIVAQGTEAGGHGGVRSTLPLVPAVVDAVHPIPVLAAGGVADGRGLAAALSLGAAGALVGTRFYAAEEAIADNAVKQRLLTANGDETLRTRVFDIVRGLAWPEAFTGRAIANEFTAAWHGREDGLQRELTAESNRYVNAYKRGDVSLAVVWAGEGLDLIRSVEPAAAILKDMMREAKDAIESARRATTSEHSTGST